MITIRREQMQALKKPIVDRFKRRLLAHLEAHVRTLGSGTSRAQIAIWMDQDFEDARTFGFLRECDIARFATIACTYLREPRDRCYPSTARAERWLSPPSCKRHPASAFSPNRSSRYNTCSLPFGKQDRIRSCKRWASDGLPRGGATHYRNG